MKYKYRDTQMAKQQKKTITSGTAGASAAAARGAGEPVVAAARALDLVVESAVSLSAPEREQIAQLAYSYWQARGVRGFVGGGLAPGWSESRKQAAGTRA